MTERWRVDDATVNRVWTWETADPELFAASRVEALRLVVFLNALESRLVSAEAELTEQKRIVADCAADYEMWGDPEEQGKRAEAAEAALSEARAIANDLTEQAYESTTQGGVFFDTLSALRAALSRPATETTP